MKQIIEQVKKAIEVQTPIKVESIELVLSDDRTILEGIITEPSGQLSPVRGLFVLPGACMLPGFESDVWEFSLPGHVVWVNNSALDIEHVNLHKISMKSEYEFPIQPLTINNKQYYT